MYAHWRLTEAQQGTFVDLEMGMDPLGAANRAFDRMAGRIYFRRWVESSLDGLRDAACTESDATPGG
jgi:hypothetical protein